MSSVLGLWLLGCVASGPRALPEAWSVLAWTADSADLHAALWRALSAVPQDWRAPAVSASDVHAAQWWCSPTVDANACWTGAVARAETRDTAWRGLAAVTGNTAAVSQLVVDVGDVPADGDWGLGVALRLDADDGSLLSWDLTLVRWAGQRLTARLDLGPTLGHDVEQTDFSVAGPAWADLIGSPVGFREHTLAGLRSLLAEVERGIAAHEVRRCAYGRYHGDGTPRCDLIPLSPQEELGALEQARAELGHRIRVIDQDAEVLHARLAALLPGTLAP